MPARSPRLVAIATFLVLTSIARGAPPQAIVPPGDKEPFLRLEAGGPTAFVTGLAFGPDGRTLYAAGYDKMVRVWTLDPKTSRFELDTNAYRVPLGPGLEGGALNAVALSSDGTWLAAGGLGLMREGSDFRRPGWVVPSVGGITPEMRKDQGLIYVFNTKDGSVRILRGHAGPVVALAFAPSRANQPAALVSAAREWDDNKSKHVGAVHLWDVEQASLLKGYAMPDIQTKPALAVQPAGAQPNQFRVALAWDDGYFRVWDVGSDQFSEPREDGVKNNTVAILPGQDSALTGSDDEVRVWDVRDLQPNAKRRIPLTTNRAEHCRPRALALCSAAGDGTLDHAAVVLHLLTGDKEEDWLYLLSLDAGNFGALRARVRLWPGRGDQPVLATSPHGQYLAVAGNSDHTIHLYALADLLRGGASSQELRSAGATVRRVEFAAKGKDLGLFIEEQPGSGTRQRPVFEFKQRALAASSADWQSAGPALGQWQQMVSLQQTRDRQSGPRSFTISVHHQGKATGSVQLKDIVDVTASAILPPKPVSPFSVPILAVGYLDDHLQPWLGLYNASSGEQIRRLAGHLDAVRSLAFSADGKLLASAADDQTVSIWSLTDLDRVLLKFGSLQGIPVIEKVGNLVVGSVDLHDLDRANLNKLQEGDVIEGVVTGGAVKRFASAPSFYDAFWHTKPGADVSLRVRGKADDVQVRVGQGIDERKPLFSLFLTRADQTGQRGWVGWSPLGPYESSGQPAERHLGWHFNTGDAAAPTRFALADQYRKQYYREGILNELVTHGDLQHVPPAAPPPPPKMALLVEEADQPAAEDAQGQVLVRQPKLNLKLLLVGRSPNTLEAVTYQVDDAAEQTIDLDKAAGQEWSVPLELRPGVHNVRVTVRTPETLVQPCVERLSVRYQPPAPEIKYTGQLQQVVQNPAFVMRAGITPSPGGEGARVILRQTHKGKPPVEETKTYNQPASLEQRFTLQPGYNLLELVAVNAKAVSGYEGLETQRLAVEVTLVEKTAPPQLSLDAVLPDGAKPDERLGIQPGQTIVVTVPKVHLLGKITASENLSGASWVSGAAGQPVALPGFVPNQKKEWPLDQEVQLQPGEQTFRFLARAGTSDEAERAVTLFYQPPVPRVTLVEPLRNQVINGEEDKKEVLLRGDLGAFSDARDYEAEVRCNDQPVKPAPQIDQQARKLTARVPLQPGDNRISVRLSNRWGALSSAETIVHYQRPPSILEFQVPGEAKQPLLDLVARVRSPLPLLPESVKISVNGNRRAVEPTFTEAAGEPGVWTVGLKSLALEGGTPEVDDGRMVNNIEFSISNREGVCLRPARATLVYQPTLPPPRVTFQQQDSVVHRPDLTVRFEINSSSPLKQVLISRLGDKPVAVDLSAQRAGAGGGYTLSCEHALTLKPELNTVQVEAANAGGRQVARLLVSFVHRPVRLVIDSIEPDLPSSQPLARQVRPGGVLAFEPAPAARLRLHGRVLWDEENDDRLAKTNIVRVYVNEFQQLPAELKPPASGSRERTFQTRMLLNYPKDNHVRVALPDLQQDSANCSDFRIDCLQPERAQRLHLLIVSPQEQDGKRLQEEFLQALQCKTDAQHQLKTPAFDPVIFYPPVLTGDHARPQYVYPQLRRIQTNISRLAQAGLAGNDVVVFYYRGGESVNAQGHFFAYDSGRSGTELAYSAMSCDDLVSMFSRTPGAHILLLDVGSHHAGEASAGNIKDRVARWQDNYSAEVKLHIGVLRLAWLGPADASRNTRLLKLLEEAMPKATRLVEVTEQVRKLLRGPKDALKLLEDEHLSDEMKRLVFSQKDGGITR